MRKLSSLKLLCFSAGIAFTIASCDRTELVPPKDVDLPDPFVNFEIDSSKYDPNDPFFITFKNSSTQFKELEWVFGDDSVNYISTPVVEHLYSRNGSFDVVVTAIGEDGTKATKQVPIRILPPISINVAPEGDALRFTNTSGMQGKSIEWDFMEAVDATKPELGQAKSTEQTTVYKFKDPRSLSFVKFSITTEKGSVGSYTYLIQDGAAYREVTDQYLKNTKRPFKADKRNTITGDIGRWGILNNWTTNAAVKQRDDGMGGFDLKFEGGNNMSMEAWGPAEPKIRNGKIYQSPELPAGKYVFICWQPGQELRGGDRRNEAFLIAAGGEDLPNALYERPLGIGDLGNHLGFAFAPLAYTPLLRPQAPELKSGAVVLTFENPQKQKVSMGLLAHLIAEKEQFVRAMEFKLFKAQ